MELILSKKPEQVNIIAGFPTFGLIASIVTEYLINNLKCEKIGTIRSDKFQPMIAIHQSKIIEPIEIYHCEEHNLVIVQSIGNMQGLEHEIAQVIQQLGHQLKAWELLSIEGVADQTLKNETKIYAFSANEDSQKKLIEKQIDPLKEGIIIGLTAAILLEHSDTRHTTFFATTHSQLPDSKAASEIIKVLDKYLGLSVDPLPLLAQAKQFEEKLKNIASSTQATKQEQVNKQMSYVG